MQSERTTIKFFLNKKGRRPYRNVETDVSSRKGNESASSTVYTVYMFIGESIRNDGVSFQQQQNVDNKNET